MSQPDDKAVVRAVLAGSNAAYAQLYDRYAPLVRAVCHDTTRNVADAQDLAQDVFLRAYEHLGELRRPERFGPWLIGITRRRCQEWRRRKARQHRGFAALDAGSTATCDTTGQTENGQLLRLIGTLPENERLALHAFYLRSQSVEEARGVLGLSRSGFYRVLERARNRLRKQLHEDQENIQ